MIALAAGGTGGHMFPAQSLAQEMCRRDWQVLLLTDDRGLRYAAGFPADETIVLDAANPNVSGVMAKLHMAMAMSKGLLSARKALHHFKPQFAVGFGGYPSAPGLLAARTVGIPYGVHEQNAVLGRVNRKAAKGAQFVAHGFPRLDRLPSGVEHRLHIGNPVRDEVNEAAKVAYRPPATTDKIRLLIFGGSQGARLFAAHFPQALSLLPVDIRQQLVVTHQVADDYRAETLHTYQEAGIEVELAPFFDDLPMRIAQSHFVIARAGASTVSELATIGRPALLVPLAIAMDDHQRANAEVLEKAGAAKVLLEKDLTPERAAAMLSPILSDPDMLSQAAAAAKGQVPAHAAVALADHIEKLLEADKHARA